MFTKIVWLTFFWFREIEIDCEYEDGDLPLNLW